MSGSARARLAEAIKLFGTDGRLLVFHDPHDPCGSTAEGADLAPHSGIERTTDPTLREKVREANARSRGEVL
ncbi:hypothetical protein F9278_08980 [Streptomyces phaeolivaceus]|uniref:Uncharacterized protein n=1 Tax=Streptomyces phaeolivaceus TaxID=2653200 RepID=A0A5P8JZ77_9ACTN|nr:hypothetical protein [Streptomyces phaeolivaceus]QFQ96313.1 hypothetical protein F9278_08980 [Streptomyces phaeolivaceus]